VVANRRLSGLWLIALGATLNLLVIGINGGVMPADPAALERAGLPVVSGEFENSTVLEDPKLAILGDVFAVPEPLPFANVFSIGDVVLLMGWVPGPSPFLRIAPCTRDRRTSSSTDQDRAREPSDRP
jgi:uncharacterized protein DUF5317